MSIKSPSLPKRLTIRDLQALHQKGEPIAMLTAYDAVIAGLLDQAGIDILLVGDSLGNVVLGFETTIPVQLEDMIRHTAAVVRGCQRAFVVCDLPFGVAADPKKALEASIRVFRETLCQAVKIEGAGPAVSVVKRLTAHGIPVMAHIGLTPQFIHQLGGYYQHGKTEEDISLLIKAAKKLEKAGAFAIVLECIRPEVSHRITQELSIPTIGIGSGEDCSGQVLVINDLIGLSIKPPPKFAKPRAHVGSIIQNAAMQFIEEVKNKITPSQQTATVATATKLRTPCDSTEEATWPNG